MMKKMKDLELRGCLTSELKKSITDYYEGLIEFPVHSGVQQQHLAAIRIVLNLADAKSH